MAQVQFKESDISVLIAAIQSSVEPIQVDAEKVARQLGMSLSTIPPKFTAIRKRYNIDIKVVNSGALQRNKPNSSPRKRQPANGVAVVRCVNPREQPRAHHAVTTPKDMYPNSGIEKAHQGPGAAWK